MLLLHSYAEQVRRYAVSLEAHLAAGRVTAQRVLSNEDALELCRRRLSIGREIALSQTEQLARLNSILTVLEAGDPDLAAAAALLGDDLWAQLAVPDPLLQLQSFGCRRTLTDEELLLALLPAAELEAVRVHLSRPLFERLRWSRGDYIAVAAFVILGLSIEFLNTAWKPRGAFDSEGQIGRWFNEQMHAHAPNNPIDYQGQGFGGGFHRARTRGHDLARFLEAVRQTAEGEFRGRRWHKHRPIEVISRLNQYGKAYPELDWFAALVNVAVHLMADFFSTHSLPLPLTSIIYDNCGREFRKFVVQLYEEGFHLRHVAAGALEVFLGYLAIEVWLWLQYGMEARTTPPVSLKRAEMRTSVMALLSSANLTWCVICQNPFELNVPTLIATIDSALTLMRLDRERNHWLYKEGRNLDELAAAWAGYPSEQCLTDGETGRPFSAVAET